jgi:hypothetical protein
MTARQFHAFQSAKSTAAKFRRHWPLVAANEWFVDQVTELDRLVERVGRLAREQAAASTGLTAEQGKARQDLVNTLVELCGLGEGWAASARHERLRTGLAVTPSGLTALGLRIEVVAPALLGRLREAASLGAQRCGLTPEVLDGLAAQIHRLTSGATVRDARDERKSTTQELNAAVIEMLTFLRDVLDPAMRFFQRSEPRFYDEYRNARRVDGRNAKADAPEESGFEAPPVAAAPADDSALTSTAMQAEGLVLDQNAEADAELDHVLDAPQAPRSAPEPVGPNGATPSALPS